jgi:hypothetical protein
MGTDVLRLLAKVSHNQAESAADDLEAIADKQEANLARKNQLRDIEKAYDNAVADGVVSAAEMQNLTAWMQDLGLTPGAGLNTGGDTRVSGGSEDEAKAVSQNKETVENGIKDVITASKEKVDDDQSQVQFLIQVGTSDLQNAENVRSQAEKRLETQRKDLTRNWGG